MMRRLVTIAAAAAALSLATAAPAAAFDLTGCRLTVSSSTGSGQPLGEATGPGAGGTLADPFLVDPYGSVHYEGQTDAVITNHSWHIDVYGIPILRGGDSNADGGRDGQGDLSVAQYAADRAAGLYYVSGALAGTGGSCTGSGWVKLTTDPVGTIPWLIGILAVVLGVLTLYFAMPSWRTAEIVDVPEAGRPT